ncbi:MAG: hypothetical protein J0M30_12865 [Chitinophagales bacterium]|nr:hypothetical protein [Chitinophagales bacterium]
MRMTLELEEDSTGRLWGMMYLRGFEKNTVTGCDYLVVGARDQNRVFLTWEKIVRQVNLNEETCGWLRSMSAVIIPTEPNGKSLAGVWSSPNASVSNFSTVQTAFEVSSSTSEELEKYGEDLFLFVERNGLYLPPAERRFERVAEIFTDSTELVMEVRSAARKQGDSISVYLDGFPSISLHDIFTNPLRLRIQLADSTTNEVLFVNESLLKNRLRINLSWIESGEKKSLAIEPTHTRSPLISIRRKRVSN